MNFSPDILSVGICPESSSAATTALNCVSKIYDNVLYFLRSLSPGACLCFPWSWVTFSTFGAGKRCPLVRDTRMGFHTLRAMSVENVWWELRILCLWTYRWVSLCFKVMDIPASGLWFQIRGVCKNRFTHVEDGHPLLEGVCIGASTETWSPSKLHNLCFR